jgi:glycolate oxidase
MHERALIDVAARLPSDAVLTELDALAAYARDESEAAPAMPSAVLRARTTAEVSAVLELASRHGVPVTPWAAGTGRCGGATNVVEGGWVLALERFDRLLDIDAGDGVAVVEPGVVTGRLHDALEGQGLFYGPDPNSLGSCTLGGNVATNAGGPRAVKYGVTRDWVRGLEVVLADGTTLELGGRTQKGVTGYDLKSLVVGSEGTLAVVTRATLRVCARPEGVRTAVAFFDAEERIGAATRACLSGGAGSTGGGAGAAFGPSCVELLDAHTLEVLRESGSAPVPQSARAMLLIELDGDEAGLDRGLERLGEALDAAGAIEILVAKHAADRERLWSVRREMSRALRRRAAHKLSEDVVVPRSQLGALIARCREIGEAHGIRMPAYGHAGDGNLHVNFLWDTPEERPRVDAAIEALFRAVVALGGTLSGEHGLGVLKAPYLALEQSAALIEVQRKLKAQLDPRGILNPGKVLTGTHASC